MMASEKIALFFGSYNPIHVGHLVIANYIVENTDVNRLWFVVSPQNPLKQRHTLLADHHRLEMVEKAIDGDDRFAVCDIEFRMPKPSYTADTLAYLHERYPKYAFSLIMGGDNLETFSKWRNQEYIQKQHNIIVYPRPGHNIEGYTDDYNLTIIDAPQMSISSSMIRKAIQLGQNINYYVPKSVAEIIDKMNHYR